MVYVRKIDGHYSEEALARLVGLTDSGIRAWRRRGYGPKWIKIGRAVFYREEDVADFLASLPAMGGGE